MAQSGLIGPDGLDSGDARPLYRAGRNHYEVAEGETLTLSLETQVDGVNVIKEFTFHGGQYLVDLAYRVENQRSTPFQASLFGQIKRDAKAPPGQESFSLGPQPYLGAALTTPESRYEKITFDDLDEGDYRAAHQGGWIAFLQHYFLTAWVPQTSQQNSYYGRRRGDGTYIVGYTGPLLSVPPGRTGEWRSQFYAGPKDQDRKSVVEG